MPICLLDTKDEHRAYTDLEYDNEAVNHSTGEYVRKQAHTNGIESFWSMLKRGYAKCITRSKHLQRYVGEFADRHNIRDRDTLDQMVSVVGGLGRWTLALR